MQILHNEIYALTLEDDTEYLVKCRCYLPQTFEYEFENIGPPHWRITIPVAEFDSNRIKIIHLENVRQLIE